MSALPELHADLAALRMFGTSQTGGVTRLAWSDELDAANQLASLAFRRRRA